MKSLKKITAFVLALTMVFSMLIVAHAVEERSPTYPCSCGGNVYEHNYFVEFEYDERQCSHGYFYETDTYRRSVYETIASCDSCSYSEVVGTTYSAWTFVSCSGE